MSELARCVSKELVLVYFPFSSTAKALLCSLIYSMSLGFGSKISVFMCHDSFLIAKNIDFLVRNYLSII